MHRGHFMVFTSSYKCLIRRNLGRATPRTPARDFNRSTSENPPTSYIFGNSLHTASSADNVLSPGSRRETHQGMSSPPIKRRDLKPADTTNRRSRTPNSIYLGRFRKIFIAKHYIVIFYVLFLYELLIFEPKKLPMK